MRFKFNSNLQTVKDSEQRIKNKIALKICLIILGFKLFIDYTIYELESKGDYNSTDSLMAVQGWVMIFGAVALYLIYKSRN